MHKHTHDLASELLNWFELWCDAVVYTVEFCYSVMLIVVLFFLLYDDFDGSGHLLPSHTTYIHNVSFYAGWLARWPKPTDWISITELREEEEKKRKGNERTEIHSAKQSAHLENIVWAAGR